MGDDPPFLVVGTEVSAKYKGAFCEAKVKKIVRLVKCRITFKGPGLGTALFTDDQIKGQLKVGEQVEVKHPTQQAFVGGTINKIQDCSQYTVVFDDGDITTLRRSALCLKSGRHFNESETLDQLPLTHPEHFSNPVMGGRRAVVVKRAPVVQESSDEDEPPPPRKRKRKGAGGASPAAAGATEVDVGAVICVDNVDKKKTKDNWFPALIVSTTAQESAKIRPKDNEFLVRSFKDGKYYTVSKKEITVFAKDHPKVDSSGNTLKSAIDKAVSYMERNELPSSWDRDILFNTGPVAVEVEPPETSEVGSSDDEAAEGGDGFVSRLWKFLEGKGGTPTNRIPMVCNKEVDLQKLYENVGKKGGYTKVSDSNQWKPIIQKMGFGAMPSTSTINQIKQAYKRYLHDFEEEAKAGSSGAGTSSAAAALSGRGVRKGKRKGGKQGKEEAEVDKEEEQEVQDVEIVEESPKKIVPMPPETPPRRSRSRQDIKLKTQAPEPEPVDTTKKKPTKDTKEEPEDKIAPPSSIDQQQASPPKSVRSKSKRILKDEGPPPAAEKEKPAAADKGILPEKEKEKEHVDQSVKISMGDRLRVYYGPNSDGKVTYEAKVIETDEQKKVYLVHYTGWNTRYDEWISHVRIAENLSLSQDSSQTSAPQGRGPKNFDLGGGEKGAKSGKSRRFSPIPPEPTGGTRNRASAILKKRKSEDSTSTSISESEAKEDLAAENLESEEKISHGKLPSSRKTPSKDTTPKDAGALDELGQSGPDIYEFEDDLTEAPTFKALPPRSPSGRKEEPEVEIVRKVAHVAPATEEKTNTEPTPPPLKRSRRDSAISKELAAHVAERSESKERDEEVEKEPPAPAPKERKGKSSSKKTQPLEEDVHVQVKPPPVMQTPDTKSNKNPPELFVKTVTSTPKPELHLPQVDPDLLKGLKTSKTEPEPVPIPTPKIGAAGRNLQTQPAAREATPPIIIFSTLEPKPAPEVEHAEAAPFKIEFADLGKRGASPKKITPVSQAKRASPGSGRRGASARAAKKQPPAKGRLQLQEDSEIPFINLEPLESENADMMPIKSQNLAAPVPEPPVAIPEPIPAPATCPIISIPLKVEPIAIPAAVPKALISKSDVADQSRPCPQISFPDSRNTNLVVTKVPELKSIEILPEVPKLEAKEAELPLQLKKQIVKEEVKLAKPPEIDLTARVVADLESSLLCKEEIPKSPPPNEPAVFFGKTSPTEVSMSKRKSHSPSPVAKPETPKAAEADAAETETDKEAEDWERMKEETALQGREASANLYDTYSGGESKVSGDGVDNTPPATPESTNSGNLSSDFEECEPEKDYMEERERARPPRRMKLLSKEQSTNHSDTDSMESPPRAQAHPEDEDTGRRRRRRTSQASHSNKADGGERTKRRSGLRKSTDESLYGRSDYERMQDEDLDTQYGFNFTLPPMTMLKPLHTTKFYFIPELPEEFTSAERIAIIAQNTNDLKETYASLKATLTAIERKKKKKKKEKEPDIQKEEEPVEKKVEEVQQQLSPSL